MAIKYLRLPLYNDTFYSYSVNLEGNKFQIKLLFLERPSTWIITLKDSEQRTLVSGQRLTPDTPLFGDYRLENLSGFFLFTPPSGNDPEDVEQNIQRPKDFFNLYYVYDDGE